MSRIEVTIGNATADISSIADAETPDGVFAHYNPRDLMDATASALLAINTPQSVAWARELYVLTSGRKA